jgi:hypothetical protein
VFWTGGSQIRTTAIRKFDDGNGEFDAVTRIFESVEHAFDSECVVEGDFQGEIYKKAAESHNT